MGARLYNPATGFFTSNDAVLNGGANRYAYPTDPLNMADISGQDWEWMARAKSKPMRDRAARRMGRVWIDAANSLSALESMENAFEWLEDNLQVTIFGTAFGIKRIRNLLKIMSPAFATSAGAAWAVRLLRNTGRALITAANRSQNGRVQFEIIKYGSGYRRKFDILVTPLSSFQNLTPEVGGTVYWGGTEWV